LLTQAIARHTIGLEDFIFLLLRDIPLAIGDLFWITVGRRLITKFRVWAKAAPGLEAKLGEVKNFYPEATLLRDTKTTFCDSKDQNVSFRSCPEGKSCAFLQREGNYYFPNWGLDVPEDGKYLCGVILDETLEFNFRFTNSKESIFKGRKLNVILYETNFVVTKRADLIKLDQDIPATRSTLLTLEKSFENFTTADQLTTFEKQLAILKGIVDGLEAIMGEAEANGGPKHTFYGLKKQIDQDTTSDLAVGLESYLEFHLQDLGLKDRFIDSSDEWAKAQLKLLNISNITNFLQWSLNNDRFSPEKNLQFEYSPWDAQAIQSFIDNPVAAEEHLSFGWGWIPHGLVGDTFKGYTKIAKYFQHDLDGDNGYYINRDATLFQIILEKALKSSTPLIPIETMIEGMNQLDVENSDELMILYFRLQMYLKHASEEGMSFDNSALISKLNSIKARAEAFIKKYPDGTYPEYPMIDNDPDQSYGCGKEDIPYEICSEFLKDELAVNLIYEYRYNLNYRAVDRAFLPEDVLGLIKPIVAVSAYSTTVTESGERVYSIVLDSGSNNTGHFGLSGGGSQSYEVNSTNCSINPLGDQIFEFTASAGHCQITITDQSYPGISASINVTAYISPPDP
jgi:hypothetical protein